MFDGIKLLCVAKKDNSSQECLYSIVVTSEKFMTLSNKRFKCPGCGQESKSLGPFFLRVIRLQNAINELEGTGFYVKCYELAYQADYKDGLEITHHILEHNDWGNWNLQIASIEIAHTENPIYKRRIWEDHFFKARQTDNSSIPEHDLTFGQVLEKTSFYIQDCEVKNIDLLKNLLKQIHYYNNAWVELMESKVIAAPVYLDYSLHAHFFKMDRLIETFPEET